MSAKAIKFIPLALLATVLLLPAQTSWAYSRYVRHRRFEQRAGVGQLHLLTFDQAAELAPRERVRYVRLLRRAVVQAEREQIAFHSEQATAMNGVQPGKNVFGGGQNLFAILFMPHTFRANAASNSCYAGSDLAGRGILPTDKCIYAGNVSSYPTSGYQQPFQCKIVRRCHNGGVVCNPVVFGIPSYNQASCIPIDERHVATQQCNLGRQKLAAENRKNSEIAVQDAQGFFQLDQCRISPQAPGCRGKNWAVTQNGAQGPVAKTIIRNLIDHAYSNEAYAELIAVMELYKSHHWQMPQFNAGKHELSGFASSLHASIFTNPNQFANSFNSVVSGVQEIFSSYEAHCDQHLCQTVCNTIQKYRPGDYGVHKSFLIARELHRKQLLSGRSCGPNGNATVRNVLEHQECISIDKSEQRLSLSATKILSTLPVTPPTIKPKQPHEVDQSFGCRSVYRDDAGLFQRAAQCTVCMSESAAYNYAKTHPGSGLSNYRDSTRWKALLSAMALVCGDSFNGATEVSSETMAHYVETFGQCDRSTYNWPDNPVYDQHLLQKIRAITSKSFVDHKPKSEEWRKLFKKINPQFKQVFGAKVTQLIPVFCKNNRFDKRFWLFHPFHPYKVNLYSNWQGSGVNWSPSHIAQFKAEGRGQFKHFVKRLDRGDVNIEPSLKACMNQALSNAKKLYPSNKICLDTVHPSSPTDFVNAPGLQNALNNFSPAVIARTGDCFVSHSYSTYGHQQGWEYVAPTDISRPTYQADPSTGMSIFQSKIQSSNEMPAMGTFVCHQSGSAQCNPTKYQLINAQTIPDYTIIYENQSCNETSASSAPAQNSQGSAK